MEGWDNGGAERGNQKGRYQGSKKPAGGDVNLGLSANQVAHVVELEFVFFYVQSPDISNLSQTSRRCHTQFYR